MFWVFWRVLVVSTTFSCIKTSLSAYSCKTTESKSKQTQNYNDSKWHPTQNYNQLKMTADSKLQPTQNDSRLKITIDLKLQPTQYDSRLKLTLDKLTTDSKLQHWLIDNCFMSRSKIFHSYYGDFSIDNKGLQNLDLFSLWPLSSERT